MALVVNIILMIVFGLITKNINTKKGYDGGFAWGFFLGIIGIIVVAVRSNAPIKTDSVSDSSNTVEIVCDKCGEKNPESSVFCRKCGEKLSVKQN